MIKKARLNDMSRQCGGHLWEGKLWDKIKDRDKDEDE